MMTKLTGVVIVVIINIQGYTQIPGVPLKN